MEYTVGVLNETNVKKNNKFRFTIIILCLRMLVYEKKKTETAGIHGVQTYRCAVRQHSLVVSTWLCMYVTSDAATP